MAQTASAQAQPQAAPARMAAPNVSVAGAAPIPSHGPTAGACVAPQGSGELSPRPLWRPPT